MAHAGLAHFSLEHGRNTFLRNFGTHLHIAPVYIGHVLFHSEQLMAYLRTSLGSMKFELCTIDGGNLQFGVQRPVVELLNQIHNPLNECRLDVATRKFQSLVHTCGGRMEVGLITGASANERGLRPMYSMIQNLYNSWEVQNYTQSATLNVELWPRFKTHKCITYGVMSINITGN